MGPKVLIFVSLLACQLCIIVNGKSFTYVVDQCIDTDSNYTEGDDFGDNLSHVYSSLTSKTTLKFYNYSFGDRSDKVYGLFRCRFDVGFDICNACVGDATRTLARNCSLFREAIIWYKECMVRYANRRISTVYEISPVFYARSRINVTNFTEFELIIEDELNAVIKNASSAYTHSAVTTSNWSMSDKLFTFAQCTLDITASDCDDCLTNALNKMNEHCIPAVRAEVYNPSCQLWYDTNGPILNDTIVSSPDPRLTADQESASSPKTATIAALAACAGVGLLVLSVVLWICVFHKRPMEVSNNVPPASPRILHHVDSDVRSLGEKDVEQYDFGTLKSATGDFSAESKLGEGGFGSVYKGTLENGEQLAIKRLSDTSRQGNKEFMAEARLLAKLQHRNLVKLIGFCSEGDEKLLVYEFLSNSSLERFLLDLEKRPHYLDWVTRQKTIVGIARGLQYLHEDSRITIIHRDLKPENILLDNEMNPKIADFGLARLFEKTQNFGSTIRIAGTRGYMAPECLLGEYSSKSDVYSFGVMLLEIVLGQTNRIFNQKSTEEDLPMHAWLLWNDERSIELVDPELDKSYSNKDIERCIQIGLLCVQADAQQRPTMTEVVLMLTVGAMDIPLPSPPEMTFRQFKLREIKTGEQRSASEPFSTGSTTDVLHAKPR